MDPNISEQLRVSGLAQVIVILKQEPPSDQTVKLSPAVRSLSPVRVAASSKTAVDVRSETIAGLQKYFTYSENSLDGAIALGASHGATRSRSAALSAPKNPVRYYANLGVMLGTATQAGVAALAKDSSVSTVMGSPTLMPIRPRSVAAARLTTKITSGIRNLGVPELWKEGLDGAGVTVGHLDTGVDGKHPALKEAISSYAQFDDLGNQVPGNPDPIDPEDHGTHTAGTIAGRPVNGRSIGVAPGAGLASAMVIEGGNVVARVLGGMDWAVGQRVKVLNMSLGFPGFVESFLPLTQLLRARNILPVFAVGNEGAGTSRSPGNYVEALSVGAIDKNRVIPYFSSSQIINRPIDPIVPDLVAPGVAVVSAKPHGGYQIMDGSSMATPHIAGLSALLFQAKPDATVDEVEAAIFDSCDSTGIPQDRGNRGLPNAPHALAILLGVGTGVDAPMSRAAPPSRKKKVKRRAKKTVKKKAKKKTGSKRAKKKTAKKRAKR